MKTLVFVLVHGINDTSRKFKTMQTAFEQNGYRCIVPSLTPKNGSRGLEFMAMQLKGIIDTETKSKEPYICLVAFSMGGLIARYYLQELEGNRVVSLFFSISTPHHGSLLAYLSTRNKGALQMRPSSEFLRRLEQSSANLKNIPCFSYWTPWDLMILPTTSSIWDKAQNIRVNCLCHPLMVRNGYIIADIVGKAKVLAYPQIYDTPD